MCVGSIPDTWRENYAVESEMAQAAGYEFIDSEYWFCNFDGYCPAFAHDTPTMHDKTHATTAYMRLIWPVMLEALRPAGVFASH